MAADRSKDQNAARRSAAACDASSITVGAKDAATFCAPQAERWAGKPPTDPPDISVIVPVRDTLPYLPDCIAAIRAQQDVRLEILAVDDGSVDGSGAWLSAAADRPGDHSLRVLRLPDAIGQAGARNLAMSAARGRWIAFLDSDDMFAGPMTLSHWMQTAQAAQADVSVAQFDVLTRAGDRAPGRRAALSRGPVRADGHPALADVTSCWQLLIRRDLATGSALRFDPHLRQREDRPFVVAALLAARRIVVGNQVAVLHRLRDGSTMIRRDADQLDQYARHIDALTEMFAGHGPGVAPFRIAIVTVVFSQLLSYWAPLITALGDAPAVDAVLAAAARLARGAPGPDLLADAHAMTGVPTLSPGRARLTAEGATDLLRALLAAGRRDAARALIAKGQLSWPEIAAERPHLPKDAVAAAARALTFDRGVSAPALRAGIDAGAAARILGPLQLVLHVGMPKTGSSAFQALLEENRLTLLDRGVLVPVSGRSRARGARRDRSAGHDLATTALMRGDPGPLIALAGEVRMAATLPRMIVLSAEGLLGPALWRGAEGLAALRRILPFRHVRAIGLFRDPAEWVERMFREMAANPRNGFIDVPGQVLRRLARAGLTDADGLRAILAGAFDEAVFAPYEAAAAPARLLAMAGIDGAGLTPPHPRFANPAIAAGTALNILALKRAGAAPEAIEALAPELLAIPPEDGPRPDAPLLDIAVVRAALARAANPADDGRLPALTARGCGPRPPSVALLTAALRASAEALIRARALASGGPTRPPQGAAPTAAPTTAPKPGAAFNRPFDARPHDHGMRMLAEAPAPPPRPIGAAPGPRPLLVRASGPPITRPLTIGHPPLRALVSGAPSPAPPFRPPAPNRPRDRDI
ncbi:MAG: hypothetical protein ACJAWZ_003188 [Paracoccaceae bacterium]|jgi:hypothetical protein